MTTIKITKRLEHIVEVDCIGHSGYAEEGQDIVCAGISSIVQTALLGLLAVAKIDVNFTRDEKKGQLRFVIPSLDAIKRHDADVILDTMLCGLSDLHQEYSDYLNLEVK